MRIMLREKTMDRTPWDELKVGEKAERIASLIEEILPTVWSQSDPYNLKEDIQKPLIDERVDSHKKLIRRLPLPSNVSFPFNEINKAMVKIKADPLLKQEYVNTYVFKNNKCNKDQQFIRDYERDLRGETCLRYEINESYQLAKHFLKVVVEMSRECTFKYQHYLDEKQIIKKSRFFIIGEPGVGKTTFLNYLISVYGDDIIEASKTILLRIDLNDAIDKNPNFEKLIIERFGEIYYDYFFRNGKFVFDEKRLLEHFLTVRNISTTNKPKIKKIENAINTFINGNPSSISFLKELLLFLSKEQKISYIFVFDGLDYITLDEIHTKKYNDWLRQIDHYILNKKAFKGSYILTMRDVSFHKALHTRSGSALEFWRDPKKLYVTKTSLQTILEKRLEYVRKQIVTKINGWREGGKYQYEVNRWVSQIGVQNLLSEFIAYVSLAFIDDPIEKIGRINSHADLKGIILNEGYKVLDDLSCSNYRCLMRNLNIITGYFENIYLKDLDNFVNKTSLQERLDIFVRRSYHVVRSFIVGRVEMSDYRTPYSYLLSKGKKERVIIKKIGTRFTIPPITNFADKYRHNIDNVHFRGLYKIRVLQYLKANKSKEKYISVSSILNYFRDNLGYKKYFAILDLNEMIYSQIVRVSNPFDHQKGFDSNIEITGLGLILLEKTVYNYIYYDSTLDALPMPTSLAKEIKPLSFYWEKARNLTSYNLKKTRNILLYLKYLKFVENEEIKYFNKKQSTKRSLKKHKFTDYFQPITGEIYNNVKENFIPLFVKDLLYSERDTIVKLKQIHKIKI